MSQTQLSALLTLQRKGWRPARVLAHGAVILRRTGKGRTALLSVRADGSCVSLNAFPSRVGRVARSDRWTTTEATQRAEERAWTEPTPF